jgi:diadenosine tetraphosphate (Ap4A) HIT family hydrolase/5-methylcytosine-specific restriction endonuclease McrA
MSSAFEILHRFISEQMRMAHIYQPLMLKVLIERNGRASTRDIAEAFLTRDESQIEYYGEITKRMPGRVLARHGLVEHDRDGFRLVPNVGELSPKERVTILRLCEEAVEGYLEKRGDRLYRHRQLALGDISGTIRYEILKRAGFRCELCGTPADERAIEVDHIIPRKHGGSDDPANLQALCFRCNANKGASDATDFRDIRDKLSLRAPECPFCEIEGRQILASNALGLALWDRHPVTELHTLIIPRRHAESFFDLFEPERRAMNILIDRARAEILARDRDVKGFNIGVNCGEIAGQTVLHAHIHLIPRRAGDVPSPRGGVRGVIPGRAAY